MIVRTIVDMMVQGKQTEVEEDSMIKSQRKKNKFSSKFL